MNIDNVAVALRHIFAKHAHPTYVIYKMLRVGILNRIEVARGTYVDAGAILVTDEPTAMIFFSRFPGQAVDLTPLYAAAATGIWQDVRFARFWIDRCQCRNTNLPRLTICRICGDTGRVVIA